MRSKSVIALAVAGVAAVAATSYAMDEFPLRHSGDVSGGLIVYSQQADIVPDKLIWYFPDASGELRAYSQDADVGPDAVTWYFADGSVAHQAATSDVAQAATWHWYYPDGRYAEQTTTVDGITTDVTWHYPDGSTVQQAMMLDGIPSAVTWSYADGTVAYLSTLDPALSEPTWLVYYPDGRLVTADAGNVRTWYYPDGMVIDQYGTAFVVVQGPRLS